MKLEKFWCWWQLLILHSSPTQQVCSSFWHFWPHLLTYIPLHSSLTKFWPPPPCIRTMYTHYTAQQLNFDPLPASWRLKGRLTGKCEYSSASTCHIVRSPFLGRVRPCVVLIAHTNQPQQRCWSWCCPKLFSSQKYHGAEAADVATSMCVHYQFSILYHLTAISRAGQGAPPSNIWIPLQKPFKET